MADAAQSNSGRTPRPRVPKTSSSRELAYKLAYDEGKRTVDDQLSELDSMRQRSVQFLAFVGAATAFLVGTGVNRNDATRGYLFYALVAAATIASIATVIAVAFILLSLWWAKRDPDEDVASKDQPSSQVTRRKGLRQMRFQLRLSPQQLVEWGEPEVPDRSDADLYRNLARYYEQMKDWNAVRLDALRHSYIAFILLGFCQVILWVSVAWNNG